MQEFTLDSFYNSLISHLANGFPYMQDEELDRKKHPKRNPLHLINAVFDNLPSAIMDNSIVFDIGSGRLENTHPYYHILEDSEVIQIRGKGTKKSKGSQDSISDKSARDYGVVKWGGKTFSQEYRRNIRGKRSRYAKARQYIVDSDGQVFKMNKDTTYYANIHYHYIEKAIDKAIPQLCSQFGLKSMRVQDTHLSDEWQMQQDTQLGVITPLNILDIFGSFEEE